MPKCAGSKPDGSPCQRLVGAQQRYCFSHDPRKAEARRRVASKGGRSRGTRTYDIEGVSKQLQDIADGVLAGTVARQNAIAAVQALNAKLRALALLKEWRALDEIAAELEEVRELVAAHEEHQRRRRA